jgi:hypothetical protein
MKHLTAATLSGFTNIYFAGISPLNIAVTENGMGRRCLGQILASVGWVTRSSKGISVTVDRGDDK